MNNRLIKIAKNELLEQINNDNIFQCLKEHYYNDIIKSTETFKNSLKGEITDTVIKKYFETNYNYRDYNEDDIDNDENSFANKLIELKQNRLKYLKLASSLQYNNMSNKALISIIYKIEKDFNEKIIEIKKDYEKKYYNLIKIFLSINLICLIKHYI